MTTRKRLFALLLCLVMLVSLLPVSAFAVETEDEEHLLVAEETEANEAGTEEQDGQEDELLTPDPAGDENEQPGEPETPDEPEIPAEPETPDEPETPAEPEDDALLQEAESEDEEDLLLQTQSLVEINSDNFPDDNFRTCVQQYDTSGDGFLSDEEIQAIRVLGVSNKRITTVKGLEYFTALESFTCYDNKLTELDVSKNTALKWLYCNLNQLTTLTLGEKPNLVYLTCHTNQLTELDVTGCPALTELDCYKNQLTSLDLSKNTALTELFCHTNPLKTLDLSENTALENLYCGSDQLTELDVSKNTVLRTLSCDGNQLTELDVSKNTALKRLSCNSNQLTTLTLGESPSLTELECYSNPLETLDVSECPNMRYAVEKGNSYTVSNHLRYYANKDGLSVSLEVSPSTVLIHTVSKYEGPFRYCSADGSGRDYDTQQNCYYNDNFFDTDSYAYNHSLARISLSMAMAAYNSLEATPFNEHVNPGDYSLAGLKNCPAKNVVTLMDNCGFSEIAVNEDYLITTTYGPLNSGHNIGICIGSKKLADGTPLIAVALRGGGYGDEWIGNFTVYNSGTYHMGFDMSSNEVLNELRSYVASKGITGDVKLWITGYSRAAATANLAAGKLVQNGALASDCSVASDAIYAYCFETPRGTKSGSGSQYNGIWNIVNPTDPVPMVAMEKWGYGHFGRTGYLPSKNTRSQVFKSYKSTVLSAFNEYSGLNKWFFPTVAAQEYVLTGFVNSLAGALGSDSTDRTMVATDQIQGIFKKGDDSSSTLKKVFSKILVLPIWTELGLRLLADAVLMDLDTILISHYSQMTLAWMNTIPAEMIDFGSVKIRYAKSNCPVDLAVYDENDVLQLRIIDDEVIYEDGAYIEAIVDTDGQKVVCIPQDVEVRIEVLATDDGEFNYSVQEYDLTSGEVTRAVNYYEVEIHEGDSLTADVSTADEGTYTLTGADGQTLSPDEDLSGDAVVYYTVTVAADGAGAVDGAGLHARGDFAQVTATADNGANFTGWYDGESKLSDEAAYRFRVTGDVTLTAHFAEAAPAFRFKDVADSSKFYYEPVYWAFDKGITTGTTATTFSPDNGCTRGQIVTFLWRAKGCPEPTVKNPFKDIKSTDFCYKAVLWAYENGITTGTTPTTFSPNNLCTREQCVTFLWRSAGKPTGSPNAGFTDVKPGAFYADAVSWAFANGVTTGITPTKFGVGLTCTRGQIVTFIYRYMNPQG